MLEAEIQNVLEVVIRGLVDYPEEVKLSHMRGDRTHVFAVSAAASDVGKIIGKQGSMAQAIRKILSAMAAKHEIRAILEINEPMKARNESVNY